MDAGTAAERAQQAADRNRALRLRRLVAALTVLVLVTVGLAGYAFQQRQAATRARDNATAARNTAQSREVAIEADQIRGQNAGVAAQLSLAAYRIAPTADARASLLESSGSPAGARLIDSAGVVQAVSLSPGHRLLAVAAADGSLRLWNVARPGHPVPAGAPLLAANRQEPLYAVAFSPDGSLLAAAGAGRTVMLWNMRAPGRPDRVARLTGPASTVYSLAFSSRGSLLAAGSADHTVRLWSVADPADPKVVGTPLTGPGSYVQSVAFSPDAAVLAAGSADKTVRLWDVSDPAHPRVLGRPLTGPAQQVDSVAFSPDGRLAGRREPGRQGLAVERDDARPAGPGGHPDRGHRLGERGRVQPGRAQPGRGQQRRPGAGLGPGHPGGDRRAAPAATGHVAGLGQRRPPGRRGCRRQGPDVGPAHPGAARGRRGEQRRLRPRRPAAGGGRPRPAAVGSRHPRASWRPRRRPARRARSSTR